MNAITVNSFPAINSFNAARSWMLAVIVLVHFGLFWALSTGLAIRPFMEIPTSVLITPPIEKKTEPSRPPDKPIEIRRDFDPHTTTAPQLPEDPEAVEPIQQRRDLPPPAGDFTRAQPVREPMIAEPQVDPRIGLVEPFYPAASIRGNQAGTVILSVKVLATGRVGEVRVEESSGYARLDEAAVRTARQWRLRPGTRDGAPIEMWKQIPVTFRLNERVRL